MTGRQIKNYNQHVRVPLGGFVRTHEDHNKNSMAPPTIRAICLGPNGNEQGSRYFMNLATGTRITRTHFTYLPMTDDVITLVTAMGAAQNMPTTVTFGDREAHELWDVDGEVDNEQDSDYKYEPQDDISYTDSSSDDDDDDDNPRRVDDAESVDESIANPTLPNEAPAGVNNSGNQQEYEDDYEMHTLDENPVENPGVAAVEIEPVEIPGVGAAVEQVKIPGVDAAVEQVEIPGVEAAVEQVEVPGVGAPIEDANYYDDKDEEEPGPGIDVNHS